MFIRADRLDYFNLANAGLGKRSKNIIWIKKKRKYLLCSSIKVAANEVSPSQTLLYNSVDKNA